MPPSNDAHATSDERDAINTADQNEARELERATEKAVKRELRLPETVMSIFTVVIACSAIAQCHEMQTGGLDTHNLAVAAERQAAAMKSLAAATANLRDSATNQATAAQNEATAMDKLRQAGEAQALAADKLRQAGEAQALSTAALAENSGKQIGALLTAADAAKVQADAAKAQAASIGRSADAALVAAKATDNLADSGRSQVGAIQQSLDVSKTANEIASRASAFAERPWLEMVQPLNEMTLEAGKDFAPLVPIVNHGGGPAMQVTYSLNIDIFPTLPLPDLPDLPPCGSGCQVNTIFPTMGGVGGFTLNAHPTIDASRLTADEVARLDDGRDVIILRTRIDYFDNLGNPHATLGCSFYQPRVKGKGLNSFTACAKGITAY